MKKFLLILFLVLPFTSYGAWVATDDFESYSNGDLNGQSGGTGWSGAWSGSTAFDVQGTTVYEGTKAVKATNPNGVIDRILTTGTNSGTVYFALRRSGTTNDGTVDFRASGTNKIRISLNDNNIRAYDNSSFNTILTGFATDTWYLFEVIYTDTSYTIKYHDGASWSSSYGPYTIDSGNVTGIRLSGGGSGTGDIYWDYIGDTDPTVIYGCTDPEANNYDPTATEDDDSCTYDAEGYATTTAYINSINPDFRNLTGYGFDGIIAYFQETVLVVLGSVLGFVNETWAYISGFIALITVFIIAKWGMKKTI